MYVVEHRFKAPLHTNRLLMSPKLFPVDQFKVEMIDLKALHATQPASANVTPGRMSSAAKMRPIHSNKPSMRE